MLVSVIIPVRNDAAAVAGAIGSVTAQTFKPVELIVIDGRSEDGTADVVRKFEPRYFITENDRGIYDAMNKGIERSHGEWLLFLGADDRLAHPDVLKNIFNESYAEFKLIYGDVEYTGAGNYAPPRKRHRSSFGPALYFRNVLHHQSVFYHRDCFSSYRFDPSLAVLGDYELNLKLYRNGIPGSAAPFRAKRVNATVALCGTNGVSKHYHPSLYREEWKIKSRLAPWPLRLPALLSVWLKYLVKRIFPKNLFL